MNPEQMRICLMKILSLLPALFLTACASLSLDEAYKKPTFDYQSTKVTGVSFTELSAQSVVQIKNTNPYALPLSHLTAKLKLEGEDWLDLKNDSISRIPAGGTTTATFDWALIYDQLLARMANVYQQGEANLTLVLEPTLDVPLLGSRTLTWQSDFSVPIPKLPTLSVKNWRVSSISFKAIELSFDLAMTNPNVFSVNTRDWQAGFKQKQRSLASIRLKDTQLPAKGATQETVTFSLSIAEAGMSVITALKGGQWPSDFSADWQGDWASPDLSFDLPSLAGKIL